MRIIEKQKVIPDVLIRIFHTTNQRSLPRHTQKLRNDCHNLIQQLLLTLFTIMPKNIVRNILLDKLCIKLKLTSSDLSYLFVL